MVAPRSLAGALVAVLLLAVVVPLASLGTASPAGAVVPGSVVELPVGFNPEFVNNKGEVAGTNGTPRLLAIWRPDGTLTEIVGSLSLSPLGFNDDGEILTIRNGQLEIWSTSGSKVLPKPNVAGQERSIYTGFGPDVNGRTVATFGWIQSVSANAAAYQGSASPTLITALSTVMKVADNGLAFGQLDGPSGQYAFLDGSTVTNATGLALNSYVTDISGEGHVLGSNGSGPMLYKAGTTTSLPFYQVADVNDEGAVVGNLPFDRDIDPTYLAVGFRAPTGQTVPLKDIVGDLIFRSFYSALDMNDQCQVLGQGLKQTGGSRFFLADIPNCAGDVFEAELEVSDGGAVVNREFELTLTLSSEASDPVTDLALGAAGVGISAPADELEVISGPTPAPPSSIAANGSTSVTYRVTALKPGPLTIQANAIGKRNGNAIAAETSLELDVKTAGIGGSFFRTDNKAPFVKTGEPAPVRLRLANETGEDLTQVRLADVRVVSDEGETGEAELEQDGDGLRGTLDAIRPGSLDFVDYALDGKKRGHVLLQADVTARDESGDLVEATIETRFNVTEDILKVNIELDPPEFLFEDLEDVEPEDKLVTITETVSFTNNGPIPLKDIRLTDLDVSRVFSGQELYVTFKEGLKPDVIDPEILVPSLEPGATSPEFTAIWEATDDGEVDFTASATSVDTDGKAANSVVKKRWKAKPTKYLKLTSEVVNPPSGEVLDAGTSITVNGTIKNLSNTATLDLGPLFPTLEGNTGTMSVAYADADTPAVAPNPRSPVEPEPLQLDPSEEKNFQVRITTNFSDPRLTETQPSGGTRAIITFEPWAVATELDDSLTLVKTYDENEPGQEPDAQVEATVADLRRIVSIDDSIALPESNPVLTTTAFLSGTIQGLYNAAISAVYAIPDLVKMPYTILRAAYEYQAKVWDSFTPEEKELFLTETSFLIVSVLKRNVEFGLKDGGELYDQVYDYTGKMLIDAQNEWETGDFESTSRMYGRAFGETLGNVAGPMVLTKMAQSPKAVLALERAQVAIQARMGPTLTAALRVESIDGALPLLRALENGTQLQIDEIAKLYGISAEEVAEFQRIANKFGFLVTVRSRHASSIQWIKKFGAMLKPEAIKIKTVSELDVKLGYRADDLGSVIFRRPDVLKSGSGEVGEIAAFVRGKGFTPGTKEYTEAVDRVTDRIKEWDKYEKAYKQYDQQGWIKTNFNYDGNALTDLRSKADQGKFTGFKLVETSPGSEEFVVQLLNAKTGKFRRVTGDIDPIAFTYTDGMPLSEADHRKLLEELKASIIGAEHGESASFTQGGVKFVSSQFKPDEPGIQFAPDTTGPRVVRLDVEKSRWVNPRDYNLHWEGGFINSGTTPERAVPGPYNPAFGRQPLPAPKQVPSALPSSPTQATVGRCTVSFKSDSTPATAAGTYVAADGYLTQVNKDGAEARSELHSTCFAEGDPESVTVAPVNSLAEPTQKVRGERSPRLDRVEGTSSARAIAAGSTTLDLTEDPAYAASGGSGFSAGQQIVVGAGTSASEIVTVASATGSRLVLTTGLDGVHVAGEVVVMVRAADGTPVPPLPEPTPQPPDSSDPADPAPSNAAAAATGTLPRTGDDPSSLLVAGLLALVGGVFVSLSSRRTRQS